MLSKLKLRMIAAICLAIFLWLILWLVPGMPFPIFGLINLFFVFPILLLTSFYIILTRWQTHRVELLGSIGVSVGTVALCPEFNFSAFAVLAGAGLVMPYLFLLAVFATAKFRPRVDKRAYTLGSTQTSSAPQEMPKLNCFGSGGYDGLQSAHSRF